MTIPHFAFESLPHPAGGQMSSLAASWGQPTAEELSTVAEPRIQGRTDRCLCSGVKKRPKQKSITQMNALLRTLCLNEIQPQTACEQRASFPLEDFFCTLQEIRIICVRKLFLLVNLRCMGPALCVSCLIEVLALSTRWQKFLIKNNNCST